MNCKSLDDCSLIFQVPSRGYWILHCLPLNIILYNTKCSFFISFWKKDYWKTFRINCTLVCHKLLLKQFNTSFFRRTLLSVNLHNPTYILKFGDLELSQKMLQTYRIYLCILFKFHGTEISKYLFSTLNVK